MKKIKIPLLKAYRVILTALMAVLGFSTACNYAHEYGTPTARYIVKGKVTSSKTNDPIPNIQVIMLPNNVAVTGASGNYLIFNTNDWIPSDDKFKFQFQDIDNTANGEFQDMDTVVQFLNPQFTNGDDSWYMGETTTEFNIKLDPK